MSETTTTHTHEKIDSFKTRNWVVTNWNMNCEEVYERHKDKIRYIAWGNEICPSTHRPHQQTFVCFYNLLSSYKNVAALFTLKESDIWVRCGKMRGSLKQNEVYCSKEDTLHELGDKPSQGQRGDLDAIRDQIMEGQTPDQICEFDPWAYHKFGRTMEKLRYIYLRKQYRKWDTQVIWLHGPTATGKSDFLFRDYDPLNSYDKVLDEEFWDGYDGHETVLFDEFRGQIPYSYLLRLCDKHPLHVKVKGKERIPFLAKTIIISSSQHPRTVYRHVTEPVNQLLRRIKIVDTSVNDLRTLSLEDIMEQKYSQGNINAFEHSDTEAIGDYWQSSPQL